MNGSNLSRSLVFAGLNPNAYTVLLQKEDPAPSVMFNYHGLNLRITADHLNQAVVTVKVQESPDGLVWTTKLTSAPIVPGGEYDLSTFVSSAYVRVVAFSTGVGRIDGVLLTPEEMSAPSLKVATLACATACEVEAES